MSIRRNALLFFIYFRRAIEINKLWRALRNYEGGGEIHGEGGEEGRGADGGVKEILYYKSESEEWESNIDTEREERNEESHIKGAVP